MARGRLVSRTLGSSRKFAALLKQAGKLGEFCQVLYPLLVSNSDDFGRLAGDAFTVKHAVFPTSPRREPDFQAALVALHEVGLIRLYEGAGGELVIQIDNFIQHQPGLSKRTRSRFPDPPVNITGVPAQLNRTEEKRTEENRTSHTHARTPVDVELVQQMTDRYAELHLEIVGVGYIGNMGADYQEWIRLLSVFEPEMLKKLMVYWFHTKDKFTEDGTRTVAKFRSRASKYAEELKAKKLA